MKPEQQFESDLFKVAKIFNCRYIKIPDVAQSNFKERGFVNKESKRPFDSLLITPRFNFCIECKINSNVLLAHQELNQKRINLINKSFYVIRKRIRKTSIMYQIEQDHEKIFESKNLEDIILYFKNI